MATLILTLWVEADEEWEPEDVRRIGRRTEQFVASETGLTVESQTEVE